MGSIVAALDFSYVMLAFMGCINGRGTFVLGHATPGTVPRRLEADNCFPEISPLRILSTDRWVAEIQFRSAQH